MRRALVGLALVAHGLAHALPAAQAGSAGQSWLLTPLGIEAMPLRWVVAGISTLAMGGFLVAGFAVWGVPAFRGIWRRAGLVGAGASAALILLFWLNAYGWIGLAIDVAAVLGLRRLPVVWTTGPPKRERERGGTVRRVSVGIAHTAAVAFVAWLTVVSLSAPWHRFWGSTPAELAMDLPGDQPLDGPPTYWIQHAVSIDAPPDIVWPWLTRLGTDEGGFYSFSWLERLLGIDVRIASRIVEPNRVTVLELWGAFVLEPTADGGTRFIVRTRSGGPPDPLALATSWFSLTVFEPARSIMERQMLLGVKRRAEGTIRES